MTALKLEVHSTEHLAGDDATMAFGARLSRSVSAPAWVHMYGDLGAGKTTLARGFLAGLGHTGQVRSPTYTLVETYTLDDVTVHHLDLYRLGSADELYDMGVDDLAATPAIWLIEWPERAEGVLPDWTHRIVLDVAGTGRDVSLTSRRA